MITLIGDIMLDHTFLTVVKRVSPEAPVPVCEFQSELYQLGGAGNVAAGIASLGGLVKIFSAIGEDVYGQILRDLLTEKNIDAELFRSKTTTRKLRIKAEHQQLLRIDFDGEYRLSKPEMDLVSEELAAAQIVVLSDYDKGVLSESSLIIERANKLDCRVLVDPKTKDFSRYKGAWLVKPNYKEFCAVVGNCRSEKDIYIKAKQLIDRYDIKNLLITCGPKGMILVNEKGLKKFDSKPIEVFDVTGAGDTVIAALAFTLDQGWELEQSVNFAVEASACAVARNGTQSVTMKDIVELRRRAFGDHEVSLSQKDRKIVFTNGCFDILHAGHVHLLEKAKELGTYLIVGLNSDESVRRLKGRQRPVNSEKSRRQVLSALRCVDEVIIFPEDTPFRLIDTLKPDILVKGSDYEIANIVGAEQVLKRGGIVKTIEFIDNISSSKIIDRISNEN